MLLASRRLRFIMVLISGCAVVRGSCLAATLITIIMVWEDAIVYVADDLFPFAADLTICNFWQSVGNRLQQLF